MHYPCKIQSLFLTTEALVAMGYNRQEIEASLSQVRYDDVFATYLLLGRKSTDVRESNFLRGLPLLIILFSFLCVLFSRKVMALDLDLLCHCEISQSTKLGPILEVQLFKVPLIVAFTEAYRRRVPNLVVVHHPVRKRYVSVRWGIY